VTDDTPFMAKVFLGRLGERLVAERLTELGYRIVETNVRLGPLELDLVARTQRTLIFCEVRTRSVGSAVDPLFTFSEEKRRRVRLAAARYLASRRPSYEEVRFDAAAVWIDMASRRARIRYVEGAF
jgi:putative endonuclease